MPILLAPPLLAAGTSLVLAILGIGFLIFVHELGHYLACRLTTTRVETFSIGFGTRLFGWESLPGQPKRLTWGRRRLDPADHAMDFRVALVPLGGYVKMAGENPGEEKTGAADEFAGKGTAAKVFIVSAGVIMNVITAAVFYFLAYAGHVELPPPVAGEVVRGGPAWEAGVAPGDRVVALGDRPVRSFQELQMETVFLTPNEETTITVRRGEETVRLPLVPRYDDAKGAVQLAVGQAMTLEIEQGDRRLVIGPQAPAHVAGIPVTGGGQAISVIGLAIEAGPERFEVQAGDEPPLVVHVETESAGEQAPWRIGIAPHAAPVIEEVRGAAATLGLAPGDELLALVGPDEARMPVADPDEALRSVWQGPWTAIEVRRGDETLRIPVDASEPAERFALLLDLAFRADASTNRVRPVPPGTLGRGPGELSYRYPASPAADAGLEPGDRIVRIGERKIESFAEIVEAAGAIEDATPLSVVVQRGEGEPITLQVTPVQLEAIVAPTLEATPTTEPYQADGIGDVAGAAVRRTGAEIRNVFRLIGALFTGTISFEKNIGGPVTIVSISQQAAQRDPLLFLLFLAYISVTLAVLNILPIPVLDGGHLLFILIEKVKGSPLSEPAMAYMQMVGMALLLVLMFFAFKNDLSFLFG